MSVLVTQSDAENKFLSRREISCKFPGMGGKLEKMDAVSMVTKELGLEGKIVIPIVLKNHVGKTDADGIFYVYEDEKMAKEHIKPSIMKRFEKAKVDHSPPKDADEDSSSHLQDTVKES